MQGYYVEIKDLRERIEEQEEPLQFEKMGKMKAENRAARAEAKVKKLEESVEIEKQAKLKVENRVADAEKTVEDLKATVDYLTRRQEAFEEASDGASTPPTFNTYSEHQPILVISYPQSPHAMNISLPTPKHISDPNLAAISSRITTRNTDIVSLLQQTSIDNHVRDEIFRERVRKAENDLLDSERTTRVHKEMLKVCKGLRAKSEVEGED